MIECKVWFPDLVSEESLVVLINYHDKLREIHKEASTARKVPFCMECPSLTHNPSIRFQRVNGEYKIWMTDTYTEDRSLAPAIYCAYHFFTIYIKDIPSQKELIALLNLRE